MEISVEATTDLERKMTIAVPCQEVDSAVLARLEEAARNVKMNGFRKGKIPLKVIKNRFGKGVRQEVVGELMNRSYYEALSQESIRPASQPTIEATQIEEGEDLKFTAVFEVYPDVEVPDFTTMKLEKLVADLNDENIDAMVETLREQRQTWEKVDRAAESGDMVNIDYLGRSEGEEFQGGEAKGTDLVLGSKRMIPGFEDGLIGKKGGDIVTLILLFPETYHNAELAGKETEFEVEINSVSKQVKPELNEEFFAAFGVEEGGEEAFRKEVSENMEREMNNASRKKLKNKAIDALIEQCDLKAPQALVDSEIANIRNQTLQQMGGGQNIDPSLMPDDLFREQASRRVISGLILGEVINQQNLKPDKGKVRESIEEIASTYESPDEVINWYYGNEEQLAAIESTVLEDQVFDHIFEQADLTEVKVTYEEVIQSEAPAASEPELEDLSQSEAPDELEPELADLSPPEAPAEPEPELVDLSPPEAPTESENESEELAQSEEPAGTETESEDSAQSEAALESESDSEEIAQPDTPVEPESKSDDEKVDKEKE
jgi:trigger factor